MKNKPQTLLNVCFSYQVSIQWKDLYGAQTDAFQLHICSGIIIHEKYVLTPASCLLIPIINTEFRFDKHAIYLFWCTSRTQATFRTILNLISVYSGIHQMLVNYGIKREYASKLFEIFHLCSPQFRVT